MRTLVISDLHLGSRTGRDVLRRPAALQRLCAAIEGVDRLVLLGDVVEMLEGRPAGALRDAEPVLRTIGETLGPGREVIVVPGNHDLALVRPWLRHQRGDGKAVGLVGRVAVRSSPALGSIRDWLRPAKLQVRYPGVYLGDGIWAHHGHYLDRHLVRRPQIHERSSPEEYERSIGQSLAQLSELAGDRVPERIAETVNRAGKLIRAAGIAARPLVASLPIGDALAPISAGLIGLQFRRVGLPAMATVAGRLRPRADRIIFGHLHRSGPRGDDSRDEWHRDGLELWNTGCWVYEPLLLAGMQPPHPYWPGGAILIEDGEITSIGLLDDVAADELG